MKLERLTYDCFEHGEHCWQIKGADDSCCAEVCETFKDCSICTIAKAFDRLAEIEDILGDEYDLDRLRELVEADRDGRCVVLPCKDWLDIVFGEQETFYGIDYTYQEDKIREITVINEERLSWYDGWKNVIFNGTDENGFRWEFSPEDIGKTVFLTREEAEAALNKMKEAEPKEGGIK